MSEAEPESTRSSYCPACNAVNYSPLSFPICQNCRHQYWAFINKSSRSASFESIVVNQCPFCGDDKDPSLASGRFRCRKCSRTFANVSNRRVYRYLHPFSLIYLAPVYLIAIPYLMIQIWSRFQYHMYYDTIPAFTLLLAWFVFRRVYRVA
ncbi:hypothetical protein SH449x_004724 [Pirellulaceae bacterium SH449]